MGATEFTNIDIQNMVISAILLPCAMLTIHAFSRYKHSRAENTKRAGKALLEITAQEYRQLQAVAVLSPAGPARLRGWIEAGPLSYAEYSNKMKVLTEDADRFAPELEQLMLAEVKRDIAQMSLATAE
jgi:hypothetical protein